MLSHVVVPPLDELAAAELLLALDDDAPLWPEDDELTPDPDEALDADAEALVDPLAELAELAALADDDADEAEPRLLELPPWPPPP